MNATDNLDNINISAFEEKVIYVYKHLDVVSHEGWLKVGQTKKLNIIGEGHNLRIIDQHEASNVAYEVLYTTNAVTNDKKIFSDHDIHRELEKLGIEREETINPLTNRKAEWFKTDLDIIIETIENYKLNAKINLEGIITDFTLRTEQQQAVEVTTAYYENTLVDSNVQPEFLWNAKPRFGKTLTAYSFAQHIQAKKVLIITNRPAIADSWYTDFQKFDFKYTGQNDNKHRWIFTASESVRKNLRDIPGSDSILTREEQLSQGGIYSNYVHFISLQDIKGKKEDASAYKRKNQWIFKSEDGDGIKWDVLIIDESHEGVDTRHSFSVLEAVNYDFALHLSGTPFKALASNKFNSKQIYNWSYTDEQNAKAEWNIEDGNNPYAPLPKLNIFTYQLSRALQIKAEEAKNEGSEYAFELGEFFRVIKVNGKDTFVYEDKVRLFLDNLANPNYQYPFSNRDSLESLRHTFWLLPGVPQSKLMKQLLQEHPFFQDYTIILAAGEGDEDRLTNSALAEVRAAINGHNNEKHPLETKTITLSCGQLTTGVTVPSWTAVLMLQGGKSPSLYMQTAFRAQNPFEVATSGGEVYTKENCYVFDFAPDRILQTLAEMADRSGAKTNITREAKVQELINLLFVYAEDDEGRMQQLDANQVLTLPLKLITEEVVNRGFMSNRLFESISGIFGAPQSVMDIINKMTPDEGGKQGDSTKNKVSNKPRIWVDKENNIHINEDIIINTTNGLLGDKQYIEIGSEEEKEVSTIKSNVATELRNKNIPSDAANVIIKELEKKLPKVVAKIPDPVPQPGDPDYHQPEKPDEKPAPKDKTEEEKTRDRLRGFSRTIPSFLMAYGDSKTTLHNFDENIPEEVFQELTSITKEEFRQLRDGFEYETKNEETSQIESRRFEGLFNENVFNASVQEFLHKRSELSDYYLQDRTQDIFEFIPPQATNQIFTPKHVVKMMVNSLEEHNPDIFKRTDTTFIDLYMKSGLYITEIVKKLFTNTRSQYGSDIDCVKHILENQVYGLAPTGVLHAITNSLIFGFDDAHIISTKNFAQLDLIPYAKDDEGLSLQDKLYEQFNLDKHMKFTAIVGNPPYQETVGKSQTQTQGNSNWIYYYFQEQADNISQNICLIYPFGGWFDAPERLGGIGKKILSDGHTVLINAYEGTSDKRAWYRTDRDPVPIFGNSVNLSAGVSIVLRDMTKYHEKYRYSNRIYTDDVAEVEVKNWQSLTPNPYFFSSWKKLTTGTKLNSRIKKGVFGIESDFVEKNPTKVSFKKSDWDNAIQLLTNDKSGSSGRAKLFWADRNVINKGQQYIDQYKVVVTSAYPKKTFVSGKPTIENVKLRAKELIEILPSGSAFGRSKLSLFMSDDDEDCENFVKYSQTNFFAFLLLQEPNRRSSFGYVILDQDFTSQSDIDWSKSIPEIDQQLYKKYGLDQKEIDFIENHL